MWLILVIIAFLAVLYMVLDDNVPEDIKKDIIDINPDDYIKHSNSKQCDGYNFSKVKGKWCDITQCVDCKATDEYWSQHPANPCRYCGGSLREIGAGIYVAGYWYSRKKHGE